MVLVHGLSATRRNVVQGSRALIAQGLPADRLRRSRPRRLLPRARGTSTPTSWATSRRCWTTWSSSGRPSWAARWAPPPRWRSHSSTPSECRRSCRSRPPTPATRARATWTATPGSGWPPSSTRAGSTRSWRWPSPATCPRAGARSRARPRASAWSATRDPRRGGAGAARGAALDRLEGPGAAGGARRAGAGRRSRDEADSLHPLGVAEEYVAKLPRAELAVEDKGYSPLAWQGARLSGVIADFFERVGYAPS